MHKLMAFVLAAFAAAPSLSQVSPPPAAPARAANAAAADPLDPGAQVPALEYRSPLSGYRSAAEAQVAPWRESNDTVRALKGHNGHLTRPQ